MWAKTISIMQIKKQHETNKITCTTCAICLSLSFKVEDRTLSTFYFTEWRKLITNEVQSLIYFNIAYVLRTCPNLHLNLTTAFLSLALCNFLTLVLCVVIVIMKWDGWNPSHIRCGPDYRKTKYLQMFSFFKECIVCTANMFAQVFCIT